MLVAVIGAGLAGLACAERLREVGHQVKLFDKGRGPGGRMATRRVSTAMGDVTFDHGAQYFTARDEGFRAQVAEWANNGLAASWPAAGPEAWVGTPTMNAPVRHLASRADVQWSARVEVISEQAGGWQVSGDGIAEGGFDIVLVAVPAEQVVPLLAKPAPDMANAAGAVPSLPCWAVMAAFAETLPITSDVLRDVNQSSRGIIAWAARNSTKPGRSGPESWVIQASPAWSQTHLEEGPDAILPQILPVFAELCGKALPIPLVASAHRWRYAQTERAALSTGALWDATRRLGVCGDWLLGPRVECAWLSGRRLAEQVIVGG
jgi:predicted NAD/FAD-dependent oxidoreductase